MNYGYLVAAVGLAVLAGAYVNDLVRASKLRRLVFANLDSAHEGGQFDGDGYSNDSGPGYLYGMTAPDVADDMELYCEDAVGYNALELLPHVQRWMQLRGIET